MEKILAFLLPLLAGYADNSLPQFARRLLYMNMCALSTEAHAKLKESQPSLDDAAYDALLVEAIEEFNDYGWSEAPVKLDQFVSAS